MPTVRNEGATIAWESQGDGPPVLLVNGLSSSSRHWHRVVPHLVADHRVITVDNRGTGESDAPRGRYSFGTMARDAFAVLDAAGVEKAHVLGISMGSCIAQEMAVLAPERISSLVLVASNPGTRHSKRPAPGVVWKVAAGSFKDFAPFLRDLVPFTYHPTTDPARVEEDLSIAAGRPPSKRGVRGQVLGSLGWDRYDELPRLGMPTLVLHGADDLLDPVVNAERLASRVPGAELVVIENASHQVFTDQEDAAMRAVRDFLTRASRGPATPLRGA